MAGKGLLTALCLVLLSCGGSSDETENLLTAPDWIGKSAGGKILVAEKALGKIWELDPEDLEIPETVVEGKKKRVPAVEFGETIRGLELSAEGEYLTALLWDEGGCRLRNLETGGFGEVGALTLDSLPLDWRTAEGGEVILLRTGDGAGEIVRLPASLDYASAPTGSIAPLPAGLEIAPEGLALVFGPGEARLLLTGLPDPLNPVVESEVSWPPEFTGSGPFGFGVYGDTAVIVPESREQALGLSLAGAEVIGEVDLREKAGVVAAGSMAGSRWVFWVTLSGYLYLYDFATGCYGDLGRYYNLTGSLEFSDALPESDPKIKDLSPSGCLGKTKTEDWTVTWTEAGWEVSGSVSGLQEGRAREGESYVSDGGEVSFTLQAGNQPAGPGDQFTFSAQDGTQGIYVGAAASALYLDESAGLIYVADTAGGRVVVVDPELSTLRDVVY